jgi:hypothetical protein
MPTGGFSFTCRRRVGGGVRVSRCVGFGF